jgi:hypothetical protein
VLRGARCTYGQVPQRRDSLPEVLQHFLPSCHTLSCVLMHGIVQAILVATPPRAVAQRVYQRFLRGRRRSGGRAARRAAGDSAAKLRVFIAAAAVDSGHNEHTQRKHHPAHHEGRDDDAPRREEVPPRAGCAPIRARLAASLTRRDENPDFRIWVLLRYTRVRMYLPRTGTGIFSRQSVDAQNSMMGCVMV